MENLKDMEKRHRSEYECLRVNCPHYNVKVYDRVGGFRYREITIVCEDCGTPLVGFCCEGTRGYVVYANGFTKNAVGII